MKRVITYRGKCLNTKEWVYGFFVNDGFDFIYSVGEDCFIVKNTVDGLTVGQYTGLKDKNGKEIYEGDIVIESECLPGDNIPRKVFWEGGAFRCAYIKKHWATGYNNVPFQFLYELKKGNIEVIGNVHDNPEMLNE